ncbi:MAG: acetate--CoA ligase family protein, partial [Hyphomicrobiaceae bacterium]
ILMVGQGGVATEVINDRTLALPPLDSVLADDALTRTRIDKLLLGYRDRPPAARSAVTGAMVRLSRLIAEVDEIAELDINPLLVDEQVRGGIVQGLGGALYEHCVYSPEGQLMVGSLADYLVPMAAEMPDIEVGHIETPTKESLLGAKGAGEAGTAGAPAAVMNAINDALRPFGAKVFAQPFTPERILAALGKVPACWPEGVPVRPAAQQAPTQASALSAASAAAEPSPSLLSRVFGRGKSG